MKETNQGLPLIPTLAIEKSLRLKIDPNYQNQKIRKTGKAVLFSKIAIPNNEIEISYEEDKNQQQFRPIKILHIYPYMENKESYYYLFDFDFYTQSDEVHFQLKYHTSTGWFAGKTTHTLHTTQKIYAHRSFLLFSQEKLQKIQNLNACCLAYERLCDIAISGSKLKQKSLQQIVLDKLDDIYLIQSKLQGLTFEKAQLEAMIKLTKFQSVDKLRYLIFLISLNCKSPKDIIQKLQNRGKYDNLFEDHYKRPNFISNSHQTFENIYLKAIYEYLLQQNEQVIENDRKVLIQRYLKANLTFQPYNVQKQLIIKTFNKAPFLLEKETEYCQQSELITPKQLLYILLVNLKEQNLSPSQRLQSIKNVLNMVLEKYQIWGNNQTCHKSELEQSSDYMNFVNECYEQGSTNIQNSLSFYCNTELFLRVFYGLNQQFYTYWREWTKQGFQKFITTMVVYSPISVFREYLFTSDKNLIKKYQKCFKKHLQKITPTLLEQLLNLILEPENNKQSNQDKLDFINQLIKIKIIKNNGQLISAYEMAVILANFQSKKQCIQLYDVLMKLYRTSPWIKYKIQKTGILKYSDNSLCLGQSCLKFNLNEAIGQKLCEKFGIAMKNYLIQEEDRMNFQTKLFGHLKSYMNQNYTKSFKSALLGCIVNLEQVTIDFFNLILSDSNNQLKEYLQYYAHYKRQIQTRIQTKIMQKDITLQQLNKLHRQQALLKNTFPSIYIAVQNTMKKIKTLINKIKKSIKILKKYNSPEMKLSVQYLENCLKQIQNNTISSFSLNPQYKPLLQYHEEISQYQSQKQWNQLNIKNLSNLLCYRAKFNHKYIGTVENSMSQLLENLTSFPIIALDSQFIENLENENKQNQMIHINQILPDQLSGQLESKISKMEQIKAYLQKNIKHMQSLAERKVQLQKDSVQYILGTK